jgi:hypothetical protein
VSFALDAAGLSSEWWGYVSTGVAFGALVLVPFLPARRGRIASVIALLAGSILSYALVVELATEGYGPANLDDDASIVVSGLLGAVLVGALTKFVVPLRTSGWFWLGVPAAGLFGGLVFALVWDSSNDVLSLSGYLVWQVAVCLALYSGTTSNNALERTRDG